MQSQTAMTSQELSRIWPAERVCVDSRSAVRDDGGARDASVELHRSRPSDDAIGVAHLPEAPQAGNQKGFAYAFAALRFRHAGRPEERPPDALIGAEAHHLSVPDGDVDAAGLVGIPYGDLIGPACAEVLLHERADRRDLKRVRPPDDD